MGRVESSAKSVVKVGQCSETFGFNAPVSARRQSLHQLPEGRLSVCVCVACMHAFCCDLSHFCVYTQNSGFIAEKIIVICCYGGGHFKFVGISLGGETTQQLGI